MVKRNLISLKSQPIVGKRINLRIAVESDAEFILDLRLNPNLNRFLNSTDPSVDKQRQWIRNSFNSKNDFHFIIEDKGGNSYGTIALYNIDAFKEIAEWGRWIIKPDSPLAYPIESMMLLLSFAFRSLKLKQLYGGANNLNKKMVDFHKLYADIASVDETQTNFTFEERNLKIAMDKFKNFHNLPN